MMRSLISVGLAFLLSTVHSQLIEIGPKSLSYFAMNSGPSVNWATILWLPLGPPGFALYSHNIASTFHALALHLNESSGTERLRVDTSLCDGACTIHINEYVTSGIKFNGNYLNTDLTVRGRYQIFINVPLGQTLTYTMHYDHFIDNTTTPVTKVSNLMMFNIHRPFPTVSSSTGASVIWPDNRGPIGLFIADGVSSAFLPRSGGWSWDEYDRDLTAYNLTVNFVYRLMEIDGFWIEPLFNEGTLIEMTRSINQSVLPGLLGSWDSPIMSDDAFYNYHFYVPQNATIRVKLHYIYRIPGQTITNNQSIIIEIGNYFGQQSIGQSISINQSVNQSYTEAVHQSQQVNSQSLEISTDSINQSINQSIIPPPSMDPLLLSDPQSIDFQSLIDSLPSIDSSNDEISVIAPSASGDTSQSTNQSINRSSTTRALAITAAIVSLIMCAVIGWMRYRNTSQTAVPTNTVNSV